MLIFKLKNGLGNQMFILAFALRLKTLYPEHEIKFDNSDVPKVLNGRIMRSLDEIFNHHFDMLTDKEVRKYCGKTLYSSVYKGVPLIEKIQNRVNRIGRMPDGTRVIVEPEYWNVNESFVNEMLGMKLTRTNDDVYYFDGFFENVSYLKGFKEEIIDAFQLNILSERIIETGRKLGKENSVAVHIRRGDYIKETKSTVYPRNNYAVCGEDYYSQAIQITNEKITDPSFYFFTDDPDYVKKAYGQLVGFHLVENNRDFEDLYLMTCCKNIILANSTFSFWGAYLRKYNGIVIAPRVHYRHFESESTEKVIGFFQQEGWIYFS